MIFWSDERSRARMMALFLCLPIAFAGHAADSDVVINEIMYHPPHSLDDLQYLELFNRGAAAVDLGKWSFTKGIQFTFPEQTKLAPGAYLVVCRNLSAFAEQYGKDIPALGNFEGQLSHGGEKIELANALGKVVETVKYADRAPWPTGPDGHGASLERISPFASGTEAFNWAGSVLPATTVPTGTPGRQNDHFSTNLPPVLSKLDFKGPAPGQKATVTIIAGDADGIKSVSLLYCLARTGGSTPEAEVAMSRVEGDAMQGAYRVEMPAQPEGTLVRFRIKAVDALGMMRYLPSTNELRPAFSYATCANTNQARIPFAYLINVSRPPRESTFRYRNAKAIPTEPTRGNGALIYVPPDGGEVVTYDFVYIRPRSGGLKVHFQKDRLFKGMSGINIIAEGPTRWLLSEPLAYEVYRPSGVPACLTDHLRVWTDGRPRGYQLLIEQPDKAFLTRNRRDNTGNLYKLIWQGQGIAGQNEKKTHLEAGKTDLIELIQSLDRLTGAEQWEFIQKHFNVPEWTSYYAVNMCIQNWDGFHNNYFSYHDTGGTGKWEIYPWDEDKTWGDYDGASSKYDWYEMPLTMGMRGDRSPRLNPLSRGNSFPGFYGGVSWWRPGGWFGAPLLANAEFRKRFLDRLEEICGTVFTEAKVNPLIDALEKKLEPEIVVRAQVDGEDPGQAMKRFQNDLQSFRNQVKFRRQFILDELPKAKKALSP